MSGKNGKVVSMGQEIEIGDEPVISQEPETSVQPAGTAMTVRQFALAMLPITPIPFRGERSYLAYLRLALYGGGAYLAWSKHRRLSYAMLGAAGLSAATSVATQAWGK